MAESKTNYYYALGRRKTSVAKVRLIKGKGQITVNNQLAKEYFCQAEPLLVELSIPLMLVNQVDNFDLSILVRGGGHHSQVGAIRLGIAKALIIFNPDWKDTLKRADLLSRDPRAKERKKFGQKGARKKRQFTKR
ncbi:MAG: 30S ribosomal protein S9 [Candidatus Saccharibacteria bacterium]|nr:30S ribosomal protein S9 [Candidatus Saccharibacteria bacterium]MCY4010674.1 30S ribosomal protein S9 [Candidatus Saccharibacteria bacterium]MCY4089074.1 30S ribosomal protein S9 [Candidatus Saccharibacteria bacterium]